MRLWGAIIGAAVLLAASLALGQEDGGLLKQGQEIFEQYLR